MPNGIARTIGRGFAGLGRGLGRGFRAAGRGLQTAAPTIARGTARAAAVLGSPEALQEEYRQKAAMRQQVLDEMAQERHEQESGLRRLQKRKFAAELALIPGDYDEKERRRTARLEKDLRLKAEYGPPFVGGPGGEMFTMGVPEEGGERFAVPLRTEPAVLPGLEGGPPVEGAEAISPTVAAGPQQLRKPQRAMTEMEGYIRRRQGLMDPGMERGFEEFIEAKKPRGSYSLVLRDEAGNITGFMNPTSRHMIKAPPGLRTTGITGQEKDKRDHLNLLSADVASLWVLLESPAVKEAQGFLPSWRDTYFRAKGTVKGDDPDRVTFREITDTLMNKVLNALSGAAISPAEAIRLMRALPVTTLAESDYRVRLGQFEKRLQSTIRTYKTGKIKPFSLDLFITHPEFKRLSPEVQAAALKHLQQTAGGEFEPGQQGGEVYLTSPQ